MPADATAGRPAARGVPEPGRADNEGAGRVLRWLKIDLCGAASEAWEQPGPAEERCGGSAVRQAVIIKFWRAGGFAAQQYAAVLITASSMRMGSSVAAKSRRHCRRPSGCREVVTADNYFIFSRPYRAGLEIQIDIELDVQATDDQRQEAGSSLQSQVREGESRIKPCRGIFVLCCMPCCTVL